MAQTKSGITVDDLDTDLVRRAIDGSQVGVWQLDIATNSLTWSKTLHEIIGFPEGAPASFDGNYDIVHPS